MVPLADENHTVVVVGADGNVEVNKVLGTEDVAKVVFL